MATFDQATMGQALARPGMDPRQWVSYGVVDADAPGHRCVIFKDENGDPLKSGPLVRVTLQPSGISVVCRVAGLAAGDGEAEWFPFVAGDEVVVVLPEGSERAPPVIVGRLNNGPDAWPTKVAGMDPQANSFAFRRVRTPYVLEAGPSLMLRAAQTGCAFTFAPDGTVFLASGDKHLLAMTASVVTLQTGGQEAMLQLDPEHGTASLYAKSTSMVLSEGASQLITGGTLGVSTSGNGALEHVTTTEAVANIVLTALTVYSTALNLLLAGPPVPLTNTSLAGFITTLIGSLPLTFAPVMITAATTGTTPLIAAAIAAGLAVPKGPGSPGIGCPGFTAG